MTERQFVDRTGAAAAVEPDCWTPVIFRAEQIAAEIERLAATTPAPGNGRRQSLLVHPRATEPGLGLAPGIRVTLSVLLPGERTRPIRHNSTQLGFCVAGGGHVVVDGERIDFERYDVWNLPSFRTYWYENQTDATQVRFDYSNAPLLEKLGVHLVEDNPSELPPAAAERAEPGEGAEAASRLVDPFGTFELNDTGAALMPYETLINPSPVVSRVLHWPWVDVKTHLDKLDALGEEYVGRRLYLLHNPATGRTNGTTQNFFATITIRPPGIVDRPHRHISAAINYFFHGSGYSTVLGERYEWSAGDLMLTAPGWATHHHASNADEAVYELTIQDQPLHIAMESLLWQENLDDPPRVLGAEPGFATNRGIEEARR